MKLTEKIRSITKEDVMACIIGLGIGIGGAAVLEWWLSRKGIFVCPICGRVVTRRSSDDGMETEETTA